MTFKNSSNVTTKQVAYEYDTLDRRVRKRVDTDGNSSWDRGEQYVYDGAHIALQFDDGGSLERRNLFGPAVDQILAGEFIGSPNETNWYLADHLGTVRDVYSYDNSTDTLTSEGHTEYDSFGNIISGLAAATDAHFAYTGREWDADAELFYYRARWYDAMLGQFISQDPIGFRAGDSNVRRYVLNQSLTNNDPSGNEPFTVGFLAGLGIAFAYSAWRGYHQQANEYDGARIALENGYLTEDNRIDFDEVFAQKREYLERELQGDLHGIDADLDRQISSASMGAALGSATSVGPEASVLWRYFVAAASSNAGVGADELIVNGGQGYVCDPQGMAKRHAFATGLGIAGQGVGDGLGRIFSRAPKSAAQKFADKLEDISHGGDGVQPNGLGGINPTRHNKNCVECAIATAKTIAGKPTVAGPPGIQSLEPIEAALGGGEYFQYATRAEIEAMLLKAGNGSQGIVSGHASLQDPGHVWNAVNVNGKIEYIDGQALGYGLSNFETFYQKQMFLLVK